MSCITHTLQCCHAPSSYTLWEMETKMQSLGRKSVQLEIEEMFENHTHTHWMCLNELSYDSYLIFSDNNHRDDYEFECDIIIIFIT